MTLPEELVVDPATYAAVLGVFVAMVCYRANPLRDVNRVLSSAMTNLSVWQLCVAITNVKRGTFWPTVCLVVGGIGLAQVFLLHDACVHPHATIWQRIRRTKLAWLMATAHVLGGYCKIRPEIFPPVYPVVFRITTVVALILGVLELRKQRHAARAVNAYEMLFFKLLAACVGLWVSLFLLVPAPLSAHLNSGVSIVFFGIVTVLLLTERVFDVAGTAKAALHHLVRFVVLLALLVPVVRSASLIIAPLPHGPWMLAVLVAVFAYPLASASDWLTRRVFKFHSTAQADAREAALRVLRTADSEIVARHKIAHIAKRYLGGIDVFIEVDDGTLAERAEVAPLLELAALVQRRWLTPELALRHFRGHELDAVLLRFAGARLGGVVRYPGRKLTILLCVGQRGGGTKPITTAELEFLYELATIVGTTIDRLRATQETLRSQRLARVGRVAADFSHSSRNQISAVLALVEAVKEGQTAQLSSEYRAAVYAESLALVANHDLASEISRLRGDKLDIRSHAIGPLLQSVVATHAQNIGQLGGDVDIAADDPTAEVNTDERLFRQVMVNLLRNAVQACASAGIVPKIRIRAWTDRDVVYVDVTDNGPGVPAEMHDRLFTPWASTKPDGTGLGLAFCLQAMRATSGDLRYLARRGAPQAWFQLELRRAPAGAGRAAGNPSTPAAVAAMSPP